jgi:hypothetical protein
MALDLSHLLCILTRIDPLFGRNKTAKKQQI